MSRTPLFAIIALCACASSSPRDGGDHPDDNHLTKEVPEFSRLEILGSYDTEVVFGDEPRVELRSDDMDLSRVRVAVEDGTLIVEQRGRLRWWKRRGTVEVRVVAQKLDEIETYGANTLDVTGLNAKAMTLELTGSGSTELSGTVGELNVEMNGSNHFDSTELTAATVDLELNGSCQANVLASQQLNAEINGAGQVRYHGDPEVRSDINGVGVMKHVH